MTLTSARKRKWGAKMVSAYKLFRHNRHSTDMPVRRLFKAKLWSLLRTLLVIPFAITTPSIALGGLDVATDTVACYREVCIDGDLFRKVYVPYRVAAPGVDTREDREDVARMVIERLLIASAARDSIDAPTADRFIAQLHHEALRTRYLEDVVERHTVPLSETEKEEAYQRSLRRVRIVQWSSTHKDSLLSRLDMLDPASNPDSIFLVHAEELGWLDAIDLDENVEEAVYSLSRGERTDVIQSTMGWHVIMLLEDEKTIHLDAAHRANNWDNVVFRASYRRSSETVRSYLTDLLAEIPFVTSTTGLSQLSLWLDEYPELIERPERPLPKSLDADSSVVAYVDDMPIFISTVLARVGFIPRPLWEGNLRQLVQMIARDIIIEQRARATGFDRAPSVLLAQRLAAFEVPYRVAREAFNKELSLGARTRGDTWAPAAPASGNPIFGFNSPFHQHFLPEDYNPNEIDYFQALYHDCCS